MAELVHQVVIVGGGIAGLGSALALHRVGIHSLVLERSDGLRAAGAGIALFPNAWRALDALGVADKLAEVYKPFESGLVTNVVTGDVQVVNFTNKATTGGVRSVHRKDLLEALAEELPAGSIRFSSKLASIKSEVDSDSSVVNVLHLEDGEVIRTKVLVGCDGVNSVVAQWLGLSEPINSGRWAVRGLSEFPEGHGLKKELQQFVGAGKRAGYVPLNDNDVYWFISNISTPQDQKETGRDPKLILQEVTDNLAKGFPADYVRVVRHTDLSSLTCAPTMFRKPWDLILGPTHKGGVAVAGDAFHPMTPDIGQGGCSALEDSVVFGRCFAAGRTPEEGIEMYVKERRWRVAGLITGAILSTWVHQDRPEDGVMGWVVRCFRGLYYKLVFPKIIVAVDYDCGVLPTVK